MGQNQQDVVERPGRRWYAHAILSYAARSEPPHPSKSGCRKLFADPAFRQSKACSSDFPLSRERTPSNVFAAGGDAKSYRCARRLQQQVMRIKCWRI